MPKICVAHLTSVHPRYDTRIFLKECRSLAEAGYDVHVYVADGKGGESRHGVTFFDIGRSRNRVCRMLAKPLHMLRSMRKSEAALVHFHDPELIPLGLLLKLRGMKVIYDAHEDVPRQILSKQWIPSLVRKPLAAIVEAFENFAARRFDAVIAATPHIQSRFQRVGANSVAVRNFPLSNELWSGSDARLDSVTSVDPTLAYVGGITEIRGIREIVLALPQTPAKLILAGTFQNSDFEQEIRALPGWHQVDYRGHVGREEVQEILRTALIGLVLFQPEPNHFEALPNKMFEYMSAGVPVLASNFPTWRAIIEDSQAGECVDPTRPDCIAESICRMLADRSRLAHYGLSGREAIERQYNWQHELRTLQELYENILKSRV